MSVSSSMMKRGRGKACKGCAVLVAAAAAIGGARGALTTQSTAAEVVASAGVLFPSLTNRQDVNAAVSSLRKEASVFDLEFEPLSLTQQFQYRAYLERPLSAPETSALHEACTNLHVDGQEKAGVGCEVEVTPVEGQRWWNVDFAVEFENDFADSAVESYLVPLESLKIATASSVALSWKETDVQYGSSSLLEGAFIGQSGDVFLAMQELGEAEARMVQALKVEGAEVAILPIDDETGQQNSQARGRESKSPQMATSLSEQKPASILSMDTISPARVGNSIVKPAPVYSRALNGLGLDPYCADPYLDPYNPYCHTCKLGDLEDSLSEGYVVVSVETNRFHPNGRVLDSGESAAVACDDGYNATYGTEPQEVECSLSFSSAGNGYQDRSAPFVFVSHPPEGGGLTCWPTDELPMQMCDTNPISNFNFVTDTPGFFDIGENLTVTCQPGFTDPDLPLHQEIDELTCLAGANPSVDAAAFEQPNLQCADVDTLCLIGPRHCTVLVDDTLTFDECENMLQGGNLIEEFNIAFLAFISGFIGYTPNPPPSLSPTCGSITLNMYFRTVAEQRTFRRAVITALIAGGLDVIEFEFNGVLISFTLESFASSTTGITTGNVITTVKAVTTSTSTANASTLTTSTSTANASTLTTLSTSTANASTSISSVTDFTSVPYIATTVTYIATTHNATTVTTTASVLVNTTKGNTDAPPPVPECPAPSVCMGDINGSYCGSDERPVCAVNITTCYITSNGQYYIGCCGDNIQGECVLVTTEPATYAYSTAATINESTESTESTASTESTGSTGSTDSSDSSGSTAAVTTPGTTRSSTGTLPRSTTNAFTDPPIVEPLEDWLIAVIVIACLVFIAIIVIIILAATGHFKDKKKKDTPEDDPEVEETEDDQDWGKDVEDGEFAMKTAAAQSLVGEIVQSQVPDLSNQEASSETTDSELARGSDGTSTGAAELISSIISAIDDVDVNETDVQDTNTNISETTGETDADYPTTTAATDVLIDEVLSAGVPVEETADTVSVSGTSETADTVSVSGTSETAGNRDDAYE